MTDTTPKTFTERIEALNQKFGFTKRLGPLNGTATDRDVVTMEDLRPIVEEADAALRAAQQARETAERELDDLGRQSDRQLDKIVALTADLTRAREERDAAVKVADIRQRMIDIPTAWELTRATPADQHHEKCSYRTAAMLCDCAAARVMEHVSGLLRQADTRAKSGEAQAEALRAAVASLIERAMRELDTAKGKNLMARGMVLALQVALAESAALAPQPSAPKEPTGEPTDGDV